MKRANCKHGIPHPAYANCDKCRAEMAREDEEADALAADFLKSCAFPPLTAEEK